MIDQIAIVVTGVPAVFLSQSRRESLRRYACLFGIAGQPFWIYAAVTAKQPGVFFIALLYTAAWATGVWTHWLRPRVIVCPRCSGEGIVYSSAYLGGSAKCLLCNGAGRIRVVSDGTYERLP